MADVDEMMVVSGNGTAHDVVHEEFSNYDEEDDSTEIVARIPNYNLESKEENGNVDESYVEQVEESNNLDAFKVLTRFINLHFLVKDFGKKFGRKFDT